MNSNQNGYAARRWREAVKAKMEAGYPRERAILQVDKEEPQLRQRFLAEINAHLPRHRFNVR
jgi:hypothetical protein